jgi:hypothetical protein
MGWDGIDRNRTGKRYEWSWESREKEGIAWRWMGESVHTSSDGCRMSTYPLAHPPCPCPLNTALHPPVVHTSAHTTTPPPKLVMTPTSGSRTLIRRTLNFAFDETSGCDTSHSAPPKSNARLLLSPLLLPVAEWSFVPRYAPPAHAPSHLPLPLTVTPSSLHPGCIQGLWYTCRPLPAAIRPGSPRSAP